MKTLKIFLVATTCMAITVAGLAQVKTESFKVAGECGTCKKKIEKSAKEAGATYAMWNTKTKILTVKYNSTSTNASKIQESIANVGYDTPGFKASEEAYNKLDACCQYERKGATKEMNCGSMMKDGKCDMSSCKDCKDGKCEMQVCKDAGCCKDGTCDMSICKEKGCCKKS